MSLASVKIELAKYILESEDKELINQLKVVVDRASQDWWSELPDEVKASVERGLQDSQAGKTVPHKDAMTRWQRRSGK